MSEDKAVIALRSYVADYSSEDGMFQPKHYAREFQRILAEIDSKPVPAGLEFKMMGPKLAFVVGNQCFTLDYEPDSDDDAEFMRGMLCHALSGFAQDVKTRGADAPLSIFEEGFKAGRASAQSVEDQAAHDNAVLERGIQIGMLRAREIDGASAQAVPLTPREHELLDGMIERELHHAALCDVIQNQRMSTKQKGWDMERVALLRKLKGTT